MVPQPPVVAAFENPQTSSFVAVGITPVPQGTTLEQTISIKINSLSIFFPGFQLIDEAPATMDGKSAYNIRYSFSDQQDNSFMSMHVWTISGDA